MARVRFLEHTGVAPERADRPDIPKRSARCNRGRFRQRARAAAKCRRGVYAVEFAMLVPLVVSALFGTFEVGWQLCAAVALENAALEASRVGTLGRDNGDNTRSGSACQADVKAAAVKAGRGLLSADRLELIPTHFGTVGGLSTGKGGTGGTGVGGSFVEYRLEYRQPIILAGRLFNKSEIKHVANAIVMNEPYPDASKPKAC